MLVKTLIRALALVAVFAFTAVGTAEASCPGDEGTPDGPTSFCPGDEGTPDGPTSFCPGDEGDPDGPST